MYLHRVTVAVAIALTATHAVADDKTAADDVQLLAQCAKITADAARLACFDALVNDEIPSSIAQKRPLHLSSTLKSAVMGKPQAVLIDELEASATTQDENVIAAAEAVDDAGEQPEVMTTLGLSKSALERYTPLSLAYDLDKNNEHGLWSARPHNANYILPMHMNFKPNRHPLTPNQEQVHYNPNEMRVPELKFQLSLKTKAAENLFGTNADLWLGYTQQSIWQIYNEDNSRPFRAHDYEPEVFLTQPVVADLPFGGKLRMLGVGAVHHSNGEADPLSRSWNRVYIMGGAEWGNLTVMPRAWMRVLNKEGAKPDDNPDIVDYYGIGDIKFLYRFDRGNNISGVVRYNPKTQKGALQLDYVHPIHKGISGYVQVFQGYGQSLIDYNHESSSVGVGVMLNDWMGL